ncbi:MAG: lysine--tRNA ligase [Thaumarchaeota archaeon]|nr:lysine--tRNA ligase [Nitrososphaerota archaeon]
MSHQDVTIIGRGTWLDRVASEVVERDKSLGRSLSLVRVESGLGASGLPHIGSVGDAIRSYGVKMALEGLGYKSELIAFSDDLDGFRKVPAGFPDWLNDYVAHPVTRVPDPFGCHKSFGEHVGSLLRDSLDKLSIQYTFMSGAEAYKSGLLNEQIKLILNSAQVVGDKIKEFTGQDKYQKVIPYTPICKNCGRLYTTVVTSYDAARGVVHYKCDRAEIRDKEVLGCGYEGERSVTEGEGKLVWKCEFAARWAALDIRFEAYGKDIEESVKVNDWVCEHVLGRAPPHHARYELFQDKSGRKIAKSVGNVLTPQEWLTYASANSLRLLMFKRIVGARNLSLEDIPTYMDEFDDLEASYFSETRDPNLLKDARQRGLYEYTVMTRVPERPGVHVPYKQVAALAVVAPTGNVEDFVVKRLIANGAVAAPSPQLTERIGWAAAWAKVVNFGVELRAESDPVRESPAVELDPKTAAALKEFANALASAETPDEIQGAAFEAIRKSGTAPSSFFSAVYRILLGKERGPRLGPYILDAGTQAVAQKLLDASGSKA